eukprot:TRINITY_DN1610_c0_g1_i5.p1 TRINITY_DN1610_c0_g1~~TRINITY_DN1610_c0_g1_i5.p1  ORF type:complete len:289 (+),score=52.90 TRINITY_DN1610_c0_g1_i5:239-1105(+)
MCGVMCPPYVPSHEALKRDRAPEQALQEALMHRAKRARWEGGAARALPWRAVVFDLDETTGSWGLGSLAYQIFLRYGGDIASLVAPFVSLYMEQGGARPWLREILQCLNQWKQDGRIDEVAIFTAASNSNGWVTFLTTCMEAYAGVPGLFGRSVAREDSPRAMTADGLRTVKDLSKISSDESQVVLIDDKPKFALNGLVIGVPEYAQDVESDPLRQWMQEELPCDADDIARIFAADRIKHPPNQIDHSTDTALRDSARVLNQIFPEAPDEELAAEAALAVTEMLAASA